MFRSLYGTVSAAVQTRQARQDTPLMQMQDQPLMKVRFRRHARATLATLVAASMLGGSLLAGPLLAKDPARGDLSGVIRNTPPRRAAPAPLAAPGAAGTTAAPAAAAIPDDTVLARVDGAPITQRDVRLAMEDLADRLPRVSEENRQDYVLSYLIDLQLGSRAAVAEKLDTTPEFERKAAYNRNKLLLDELLAHEAHKAVTAEAAQKTYQQTLRDLKPEEEVRARHILVDSEANAKAAIARLKAGEDFARVAAELSTDPGAAKSGGELGWFTRDRMAPEFSEAAFRLKPGEISAPVKTQFGWHVIQLEERRTRPAPSFDEVKPEVEAYLARKAQQDLVLNLRSKAKIERFAPPAAGKEDARAAPKPPANGDAKR
ncbi:hypothetical protein GCM10019059_26080 [Camelimonas fluminis]|uniref:Parvulin-like PPIase n=1 Tax=Camelimonas fluminis TaxID=1576911 RepID=A0ABV7UMP4_9HYPH|nr:peptidylprolyl isomerase [Camelimonas fluminis]GHE65154.1 hypothetical protein GCM10019059_26080 [Camelimonas fluminis]